MRVRPSARLVSSWEAQWNLGDFIEPNRRRSLAVGSENKTQPGRMNPRTRRVRQVILDAAMQVMVESGADDVTAARVAERADVARTTIYRHWPDQPSLLLATIDHLSIPHWTPDDVGDIETDLRTMLTALRSRLDRNKAREVFGALGSHAAHDKAFAQAQRQFVNRLAQPIQTILEGAQKRGDLDSKLDAQREAAILAAPLLHRHLMLLEPITDELIEASLGPWLRAHCGD